MHVYMHWAACRVGLSHAARHARECMRAYACGCSPRRRAHSRLAWAARTAACEMGGCSVSGDENGAAVCHPDGERVARVVSAGAGGVQGTPEPAQSRSTVSAAGHATGDSP